MVFYFFRLPRGWDASISDNNKSKLLDDILLNSLDFLFSIDLLLLYTIIKLSEMERKPPIPAGRRGKRVE